MSTDNSSQSAAMMQIASAIATMDQSTQQNAAMVEQTSAAARGLLAQVNTLADQASQFDAGQSARPAPVSAPKPLPVPAPTAAKPAAKPPAKAKPAPLVRPTLPIAASGGSAAVALDNWDEF
jgi:methyl-accepting chemotaxis protein